MTELASWKMNLRAWRERNGYTTPEWISYRDAYKTQALIYMVSELIIGFVSGYLLAKGY